jgi:hypothetical protein
LFATDLRDQAAQPPAGVEREDMLRRARRANMAAHLDDWAKFARIAAVRLAITSEPWTPEDETKLLELRVAGLTWHAVAQRLGRTEAATQSRKKILQLRRDAANDN